MPPRRRQAIQAVPEPKPEPKPERRTFRAQIVAAAQIIAGQRIKRPEKSSKDQDWQREVWELYDRVGELHFGLRWKAQAVSRLKLAAAYSGADPEPIVISQDEKNPSSGADVTAVQIAESFAGGSHLQQKLLRAGAVHVDAVGETYLVVYAETGHARAFAPSDVKESRGTWTCGGEELTDDDLVLHPRVPHPSDSTRVDSSIKAALPVLRELHGLNQQLLGAIDSRLAGAGLLVVPQSVSPPKKPPTPEDASSVPEGDSEQDPFLVALIEAMMTPISDRESAAAVVPLVVRVPDEASGKIQHIVFAQTFDPELRALRDEAVRRLALEMDMPPEILLGTGDVNHWGQWAIDESAIKFNIVPTAQVIVDTIVEEWYRPALEDAGIQDSGKYTLCIDASELEQRVDKSAKATDLYDRAEITGDALRRETGFSSDDEPDQIERQRIIDLRVALQAAPASTETLPVGDTRAIPAPPETAPTDTPIPVGPASAVLPPEARMHSNLDAAHVAVLRALEVAGHRNIGLNRSHRNTDVPLWSVHTQFPVDEKNLDFLLRDAWHALSSVLKPCLIKAIDSYARELLKAGVEHKREHLVAVFTQADCDAA